ncbi:MAG: hypothetical protein ACI32N_04650 [Bulleidia sp.]
MKRIILKDRFDTIREVVLSESEPVETALGKYLECTPGCGFCVEFRPPLILVIDSYTRETVGEYQILSIDTISR